MTTHDQSRRRTGHEIAAIYRMTSSKAEKMLARIKILKHGRPHRLLIKQGLVSDYGGSLAALHRYAIELDDVENNMESGGYGHVLLTMKGEVWGEPSASRRIQEAGALIEEAVPEAVQEDTALKSALEDLLCEDDLGPYLTFYGSAGPAKALDWLEAHLVEIRHFRDGGGKITDKEKFDLAVDKLGAVLQWLRSLT